MCVFKETLDRLLLLPSIITGTQGEVEIVEFLWRFEKYCKSSYLDAEDSLRKVLPHFLRGHDKKLVKAFGSGLLYADIRAKLIEELNAVVLLLIMQLTIL